MSNVFRRWTLIPAVVVLLLSAVACAGAPVPAAVAPAIIDTIMLYLDDTGPTPTAPRVEQAGRYTITMVNNSDLLHRFKFASGWTINVPAGKTISSVVDVPAGGLRFECELPEHRERGFAGEILIGDMQPSAPAADHAAPAAQSDVLGELEIHSFEMGFKPATLEVDQPGRYLVKLVNDGAMLHDITFPDGTIISANAGETASAQVDIPAQGLDFICSVPGHEAAGMRGKITMAGAATPSEPEAGADDHGGPAPETDITADPNAPEYTLFDATAPAVLEGETHEIDLGITEQEMTVAPGFVQKVWTFGGTVPGPVIRVKVGDTIRVTLKNPSENQVPHSIDFHSSQVAWNDEMTSINPGEEKVYEWTADYAGVWMYHCGTAPALHHIANGMYGMVIVEPREGLPEVDKELALVQSEWYLGPQKDLTSLEKASAAAPAPDYVVFNGVANQYVDHPVEVGTGERVRMFVLNAGPSVDSSFHVVGTIFDTVIKEGFQLTRDNPGKYGAQAVDLSPAQGAIIEFTTTEDGLYPMVTHAFNFVGRGALGLIKAGDGDPKN